MDHSGQDQELKWIATVFSKTHVFENEGIMDLKIRLDPLLAAAT